MNNIYLGFQSKKRDVEAFLEDLHNLLGREDFDINAGFYLISKKKQGADYKFSTPYTMLDLEYSVEDVVSRLKELRVEEYCETKIDKDDVKPPSLLVFGKIINDKLVYIKLKIKENSERVLCVSFHYAKDEMKFPYA